MCSTPGDGAFVALEAAVDQVLAGDIDGLPDGERLDRVRAWTRIQNKVAAALTREVRAAEHHQSSEHDGLKSMRSWLRTHTRLPDPAARRLIDTGRALSALPAAEAAFVSGLIGADQVTTIAPIGTPERLERAAAQGVDVAAVEAELVAVAARLPHQRLRAAVYYYTAHLNPDGPEPDPTAGRTLTLSRLLDGRYTGRLELDAIGGEKLATAIEAIAAASRCAGDTRTAAQRRGDALVQLADLSLASGQLPMLRTVKPHVIVTIGLDDLLAADPRPDAARTGMDATVSAAKARWLACDATISRMVISPEGLPLDVGREKRVVPPHLRRAVIERDRSCVFTGCDAPHWWCDVHHLLEWLADQGDTSLENSGLLCERHHTQVHHGFRVERDDGAPPGHRWRTFRPDGTEIVLDPGQVAA